MKGKATPLPPICATGSHTKTCIWLTNNIMFQGQHSSIYRCTKCIISWIIQTKCTRRPCDGDKESRGIISTFSWGRGQNFLKFFSATGLLKNKNWKKQHFICSNLTLFIVPFFLFFLFFLFFFFFFGGGGGHGPSLPQMTPLREMVPNT